jgi:hypothetical protein
MEFSLCTIVIKKADLGLRSVRSTSTLRLELFADRSRVDVPKTEEQRVFFVECGDVLLARVRLHVALVTPTQEEAGHNADHRLCLPKIPSEANTFEIRDIHLGRANQGIEM